MSVLATLRSLEVRRVKLETAEGWFGLSRTVEVNGALHANGSATTGGTWSRTRLRPRF